MHDPKCELTKAAMGISEGIPLEVSEGGIDELRRDIQRLMDIEAIKQLKHAYFRCLDTANYEELATIFHPDVSVHFVGGAYEWTLQGRDEYLDALRAAFTREAIGHHNGHHPEIQMLSQTEATGIWYLADNMWILTISRWTVAGPSRTPTTSASTRSIRRSTSCRRSRPTTCPVSDPRPTPARRRPTRTGPHRVADGLRLRALE
ncbi:MAG: nuclear transport factor 2 family protein [Deltaproteobacteria bacterium]|nr:nuclear transport factor 2 family protein [Deltaproteobacteria bacterium]